MVSSTTVTGIYPDITHTTLTKFEKKWGQSPDAYQLAFPNPYGNRKGYMAPPTAVTECGQEVQVDFMKTDYLDMTPTTRGVATAAQQTRPRRHKVPSIGGAIYALVSIDKYTQYVQGEV